MADKTRIEWTEATWNPVTGCTKVSAGCKHCYAERDWARLAHLPVYAGRDFTDVRTHADRLEQPLRWRRPRKVFVNSMSDLFHEAVPFEFIDQVFAAMALAPQHVFQVLTKRPARMHQYLSSPDRIHSINGKVWSALGTRRGSRIEHGGNWRANLPLPNVWLGVSVEDQASADERIPLLLETPAAVRWISAEPILGPVDLRLYSVDGTAVDDLCDECGERHDGRCEHPGIDWVVAGGESGPKARPMHPAWARSLRDQCASADVPFMFKQWGEFQTAYQRSNGTPVFRQFDDFQQWVNKAQSWVNGGICLDIHGREMKTGADMMQARDEGTFPVTIMHRVGKKAAGRLLDGVLHDGYPGGAA